MEAARRRRSTWRTSASPATARSGSSSSSGDSAGASELTDKEKATRKYIRLLAEQSTKAYGALWSALPEELRAQARQSVLENFAYGLAHWLETKLQSTEQDNVGELLAQWVALRQEDDESFDAYRARVNHVLALLDHAKEKPSARQHAFMLLDRLQPRYRPAVLALKLGDLLKKPDEIEWDKVAAFVNQHERNEQRIGAEGPDSAALVAAVRGSDSSAQQPRAASNGGWTKRSGHQRRGGGTGDQRGPQDKRVCFRCDEQGHVAAVCPNPPKAAHSGRSGKGAGSSRGAWCRRAWRRAGRRCERVRGRTAATRRATTTACRSEESACARRWRTRRAASTRMRAAVHLAPGPTRTS